MSAVEAANQATEAEGYEYRCVTCGAYLRSEAEVREHWLPVSEGHSVFVHCRTGRAYHQTIEGLHQRSWEIDPASIPTNPEGNPAMREMIEKVLAQVGERAIHERDGDLVPFPDSLRSLKSGVNKDGLALDATLRAALTDAWEACDGEQAKESEGCFVRALRNTIADLEFVIGVAQDVFQAHQATG